MLLVRSLRLGPGRRSLLRQWPPPPGPLAGHWQPAAGDSGADPTRGRGCRLCQCPVFAFGKAYLSIKQPLTANGPIHLWVSSRLRPLVGLGSMVPSRFMHGTNSRGSVCQWVGSESLVFSLRRKRNRGLVDVQCRRSRCPGRGPGPSESCSSAAATCQRKCRRPGPHCRL